MKDTSGFRFTLLPLTLAALLAASFSPALRAQADLPEYAPPLRGAPAARIGGGTRGAGSDESTVEVLAPDHVGLTTSAHPSLYWYVSAPTALRVELTLVDEDGEEPVLERDLPRTADRGIYRLSLAEVGIELEPDTQYEWFVSIVVDAAERSRDRIAGGVIRRVAAPAELQAAIDAAGANRAHFAYASHGLWYDAVDALGVLIREQPERRELHRQRAALLLQAGLPAAAAYDEALAGN